ncbi:MAG: hypothetical protein KVP17_004092 [Porospora cf. gigantea B]|nr:MAG: hypothetical protein KVP17_004092 [Porospora cf. gigantea B]
MASRDGVTGVPSAVLTELLPSAGSRFPAMLSLLLEFELRALAAHPCRAKVARVSDLMAASSTVVPFPTALFPYNAYWAAVNQLVEKDIESVSFLLDYPPPDEELKTGHARSFVAIKMGDMEVAQECLPKGDTSAVGTLLSFQIHLEQGNHEGATHCLHKALDDPSLSWEALTSIVAETLKKRTSRDICRSSLFALIDRKANSLEVEQVSAYLSVVRNLCVIYYLETDNLSNGIEIVEETGLWSALITVTATLEGAIGLPFSVGRGLLTTYTATRPPNEEACRSLQWLKDFAYNAGIGMAKRSSPCVRFAFDVSRRLTSGLIALTGGTRALWEEEKICLVMLATSLLREGRTNDKTLLESAKFSAEQATAIGDALASEGKHDKSFVLLSLIILEAMMTSPSKNGQEIIDAIMRLKSENSLNLRCWEVLASLSLRENLVEVAKICLQHLIEEHMGKAPNCSKALEAFRELEAITERKQELLPRARTLTQALHRSVDADEAKHFLATIWNAGCGLLRLHNFVLAEEWLALALEALTHCPEMKASHGERMQMTYRDCRDWLAKKKSVVV